MVSIHFTHDCTLVLYKQLIKTGSVLLLLPLSSVLGFPFYKDTCHGRAAKHQLYIIAIEALHAPISSPHVVALVESPWKVKMLYAKKALAIPI